MDKKTCNNCQHSKNSNGEWFCCQHNIPLSTKDVYYNEECQAFEARPQQPEKKSISNTSCYGCIDYTKKDGKDFCKDTADFIDNFIDSVSGSHKCFTKKIKCFNLCQVCKNLTDKHLNRYCTQYKTNIDYQKEEMQNEECELFETIHNNQPEPSQLEKELQVASNLLFYAEELILLQEYYEKLKLMGLEIPDSIIFTNTSMGITYRFRVDPIDAFEFLKAQLRKQASLLRNKIEGHNREE